MELHCICRCLVPLEVNGAMLHLLEVPWIFGSKIGSKMELRSILLRMPCVPLEANGATLHLLGMPSSTDHLTIVFNTMSIHKSSSYQTYTAIQSIVHQSSMSLLT